jgi:hypothetical protein
MRVKISVPEVVGIFKEIQEQPERIFEMIRVEIRENVGEYLTKLRVQRRVAGIEHGLGLVLVFLYEISKFLCWDVGALVLVLHALNRCGLVAPFLPCHDSYSICQLQTVSTRSMLRIALSLVRRGAPRYCAVDMMRRSNMSGKTIFSANLTISGVRSTME